MASHHGTNLTQGLTDSEVEEKRKKYGYNELTAEEKTPLWKLILTQFDDSLVKVCLSVNAKVDSFRSILWYRWLAYGRLDHNFVCSE